MIKTLPQTEFHDRLDAAILTGRSSQNIANEFGIRSEAVRRRRTLLRRARPELFEGVSNARITQQA